jgi:sporulation protein YlmC with PRC-barrel domain
LGVTDVACAQTQSPEIPQQQGAREPDATAPRMDAKWVSAIVGMKVETPAGARLGAVRDVVVDGYGQPSYAIVAYGGILGLGSKYTAVPWLTVAEMLQSDRLRVDQAQLENAPVLRDAKPQSAQRSWRREADAYWRGKLARSPVSVAIPPRPEESAVAPQSEAPSKKRD